MNLEKIKNNVLSHAFKMVDGTTPITAEDIKAVKRTVEALKMGQLEVAALEAGATALSLEIWECALAAVPEETA